MASSNHGKFKDSYMGISSLLREFKNSDGKIEQNFNKDFLKFSTKQLDDIYSIKSFKSFFHISVDSVGTPLIYDKNLNFDIYKKEAEIYKKYYITIKAKPDLNTNNKYILRFTGRNLTLGQNSSGFSITKQIGTNDLYKMNVGDMDAIYKFPVINDNRK